MQTVQIIYKLNQLLRDSFRENADDEIGKKKGSSYKRRNVRLEYKEKEGWGQVGED